MLAEVEWRTVSARLGLFRFPSGVFKSTGMNRFPVKAQAGTCMTAQTQQRSAKLAADHAQLTAEDLWIHYYGVGGNLGVFELDAYLHGVCSLPQSERNTVALALNELIDEPPRRPRAEFVLDPAPE